MLKGMREVMSGGCKEQFHSNNMITSANKQLEEEREKRQKLINVVTIKGKE